MTAADFIAQLFLARDVAHKVHLSTRSYARHVALNTFYDGVIDLADKFAEAYQGRHGLIGKIPTAATRQSKDIVDFLEKQVKEIEEGRHKVCEATDTPLQNIIDEIVGHYLSTLYKLKFLA
jgi:chloramphenicol O-acetyltransferase